MHVRWLRSLPQSLTSVSVWRLAYLPPSCDSNYLGYISRYLFNITANNSPDTLAHYSLMLCSH
ncbi:hypothetical protein EAO08_05930 [Klebsiella pneumoniae]|uniref:Uncharacterized protein n=1 Tax=Klebsiella pneumoniae TaxID=573 RepID=A0ABD7JH38_KLEPN|nr:hypothetical protein D9T22_15120 [Klebsiella pneumoniae]RLK68403.1 hypothetical protein D9K87_25215 [Klebsiella pneumoniae]RLK83949.1 hypothetical protein D9K85_07070 [Klebsiella pneumoniae]RLZ82143.1 hypothetical protein EA163_04775 [Klebsiella pneumoniae]RLZ95941.1 hypothetical protein EA150_14370 [Klebsiella pneumoniae]